jgi:hypothetical protein
MAESLLSNTSELLGRSFPEEECQHQNRSCSGNPSSGHSFTQRQHAVPLFRCFRSLPGNHPKKSRYSLPGNVF